MKLNNLLTCIIITLTFSSYTLQAQDTISSISYPKTFRSPLAIAPALAGSFGEIRRNHFHSGLDYRTNQREGYPVYAVEDGFISRLRVQAGGFGKAVYISHPNGYTSVYAHLKTFNARIGAKVKTVQYDKETFEVDFGLSSSEMPVKKGDVIAWSGNTGSSGGPHLHFELRDSKTEETINPQLFGIRIPDNIKPTISGMYMYRLNGMPFSDNTPSQYFQVAGSDGNYWLNQDPIINFDNAVGFGIVTSDRQLAGGNRNGVYSTELLLDGMRIFCSVLERFSFENSRAINSHIDYPALMQYGRTVQKSFVEPGNPLSIYKENQNNGIIDLNDDAVHQMQYIIKDVKGNTSTLNFKIKRNPESTIPIGEASGIKWFSYKDSSVYDAPGLKIAIPKGSLYNDIHFRYSTGTQPINGHSVVHHIHSSLIPIHKPYHLWVKPDVRIPENHQDKAVIVDTRGIYQGGVYDSGFIKASPKNFGSFYIRLDTIAPVIRPVNIGSGKDMKTASRIILKLSDNLSGIRSFRGSIDGKWVLFEYDLKTSTLTHNFEKSLVRGEHVLVFSASDMKMNTRTYNITFYK